MGTRFGSGYRSKHGGAYRNPIFGWLGKPPADEEPPAAPYKLTLTNLSCIAWGATYYPGDGYGSGGNYLWGARLYSGEERAYRQIHYKDVPEDGAITEAVLHIAGMGMSYDVSPYWVVEVHKASPIAVPTYENAWDFTDLGTLGTVALSRGPGPSYAFDLAITLDPTKVIPGQQFCAISAASLDWAYGDPATIGNYYAYRSTLTSYLYINGYTP